MQSYLCAFLMRRTHSSIVKGNGKLQHLIFIVKCQFNNQFPCEKKTTTENGVNTYRFMAMAMMCEVSDDNRANR